MSRKRASVLKMVLTDTFEEYAQEYDDWFVRHEVVYRAELAAVESFRPETGQGLEIGVGTGRFAGPSGIRIGVEPAQAMAEMAQTRGIQVIRGDAEALPVAAASFDFVLMVTVLCFLQNPLQALVEATRVLKPHGHLIIGIVDPDSPLGRSYEADKEKSRFYRQARFHQVRQVLEWLDGLGYRTPGPARPFFKTCRPSRGRSRCEQGMAPGLLWSYAAKNQPCPSI